MMSLVAQYRELLSHYEQVLALTRDILRELRTQGKESSLNVLVEKRKLAGESIARLTAEIAQTRPDFETLATVKSLLRQVKEKTGLLQELEEQIQSLLSQRSSESKEEE
jgi:hypothetical protein